MRYIVLAVLIAMLCVFGCDMVEEGADTTEGSGESAVDLAENMSSGTIGDADMDTGEVPGEEDEGAGLFEDEEEGE